jgi:hypothetical protein
MPRPSTFLQTGLQAGFHQIRSEITELSELLAIRRYDRECRELKYHLAALRFETALIRYAYVSGKAGFKPDQPRWPKGAEDGGRWSGGAGTEEASTGPATPRPRGHHIVPGEIYRNESLQPETRRVFEEATIGPLQAQTHNNGEGHREYTKAVKENFDRFKAENGIVRSEDMPPQQAKRFLDEMRGSLDPRIRNFNMRIIMRELRFYIRRGRGTE